MISSIADVIAGRPVVGYGTGEYLDRAMGRRPPGEWPLEFDYFIDPDGGGGGECHGRPVHGPGHLENEPRDVVVFVFDKYIPRAVAALARLGRVWLRDVFDCRHFGITTIYYDDYEILRDMDDVGRSAGIEVFAGPGAEVSLSGVTVPRRAGFRPIRIYAGAGARVTAQDVVLESGTWLYAGNGGEVSLGSGSMVRWEARLSAANRARLSVGAGCLVGYDSILDAADNVSIDIGEGSTFGKRLEMYAYAPIGIGRGCMFSSNVYVESGAGHDFFCRGRRSEPRPVHVGDRIWAGMSCAMLAGAVLGDGSVVAAKAVVNKAFGPAVMVAGIPARVVREDVSWDRNYAAYKERYCQNG